MKTYAYDPYIPADKIKEMGAEPVDTVAGLFEHLERRLKTKKRQRSPVLRNVGPRRRAGSAQGRPGWSGPTPRTHPPTPVPPPHPLRSSAAIFTKHFDPCDGNHKP